jgi:GAF domain-containing protein
MQRRGESGQRVKDRPKVRKAPIAPASADHSAEQFDHLKREHDETLEQLAATSEVLRVIRRSPTDVQPVFDMIAESAARLCAAQFCFVYRFDGQLLYFVAHHSVTPEMFEINRRAYPQPPSRGSVAARAILEKSVVQIPDVNADADYTLGALAAVGGYRSAIGIPILRDGLPIGAIAIARAQTGLFPKRQVELLKTFADQAVIAIENVRLFEAERQRTRELSEALEQQTATSEVLKVISSSPGELQPVFEAMLENAVELCGAKFGNLWLREGDAFRICAMHGAPPAYAEYLRRTPVVKPLPGHAIGRVASTKEVAHIADVRLEPAYAENSPVQLGTVDLAGARTVVAVPLLKDEDLIGAVVIYRQEVRPFTDKQIELVQNFAAQAVIAIENTRLLNELRQRTDDLSESLEQQTATSNVLEVISRSAFDLQPVFETVVESAVRVCGADKAFIFRFDGELLRMAAAFNTPPEFQEWVAQNPIRPGRHSGAARAALERRTIHIHDVQADPEYSYGAKDVEAIRTILGVPILKGDELLGVIMIYRLEVSPFTDKQIALVETFADQAAIAIENVRLFEALQQRTNDLTESLQQQTATADVLKVISRSATDVQPVFETIACSAVELCGATYGVVFRYDGELVTMAAHHNLDHAALEAHHRIWPMRPDNRTVMGRTILERNVVHIPDVESEPSLTFANAHKSSLGIRTYLGVPMLRDGTPIGAIALYRREVALFSEQQIELVKAFASQAVIAIENTRLLNELRESLQQQTATADVLKVISRSTFDLRTVLKTLIESVARLCDADKGNITRAKDGVFYRAAESYGYSREFIDHVKDKPIESDRG